MKINLPCEIKVKNVFGKTFGVYHSPDTTECLLAVYEEQDWIASVAHITKGTLYVSINSAYSNNKDHTFFIDLLTVLAKSCT